MDRLPARLQRLLMLEPNTGCWLFTGRWTTGNGYGKLRWGRRHRVLHRVVFELLVRPLGAGEQLDHLCRTRACANPAHLEPVTPRVNTQRGRAVLFGSHAP